MSIALYGRTGAGKTTLARYLEQTYGYSYCSTGAACRQVCRILFDSESKTLMNRVTDALKQMDEDVWLNAALRSVDPMAEIVFDSMRFERDYRFFRERAFALWRIEAPLPVRLARLGLRRQEYDPAVDEKHRAESELDVFPFDLVIVNDSNDISQLRRTVDAALLRS